MSSARLSLARAPGGVRRARHFLAGQLASWGLERLRPRLELAISELVTNAVTHGRGDVEVEVRCEDGSVHAEVTDHGGGRPVVQDKADLGEPGGWGLRLVSEVADDWGTTITPTTTTVWLRLAIPTPALGG